MEGEQKDIVRQFSRYVLQSVAGMVGISIYILADTFFISMHSGSDGLTVLNLMLPIFGFIFAVGSMIGIGSATRYAINKAKGENVDFYFTQSLLWSIIVSVPLILAGIFAPEQVLRIMGADGELIKLGTSYIRIILIGAPFFMMNYTFTAFARNDHAPTTAMFGALFGSGFNIIFDYVFMFPMGLGFAGAALATALSPVMTMLVCCTHYFGKNNQVGFRLRRLSVRHLISCCKLGISSFLGEIASAITTMVFNTLILGMAGNIGVAAYGVITNISYVVIAIFNGVSQGTQPLFSFNYGRGRYKQTRRLLKLGIGVSLVMELMVVCCAWGFTDFLIRIFDSEENAQLLAYAYDGMRLYFLGFLFAGINMMLVTYYSAIGKVGPAFLGSLLRGIIAIVVCAIVLSKLWNMTGIWLSFLAAEIITFIAIILMSMLSSKNRREGQALQS